MARLFQQKAILSIGRVDDVQLHVLARRLQRRRQLLGPTRRIKPIRAERDEQGPGRDVPDCVVEPPLTILLAAQAAQLNGDEKAADIAEAYKAYAMEK